MSDIDFQNGFVCGMATRGLTRSGEAYKPICWNDTGVYSYFYINFKRAMEDFSQGMFEESIIIHDSEQLYPKGIAYVSPGVYKITCNIAGRYHGVTLVNKKTSRLAFANGQQLPIFSVLFYVAGIDRYERMKYVYDRHTFLFQFSNISENLHNIELPEPVILPEIYDSTALNIPQFSDTNETATVVLT